MSFFSSFFFILLPLISIPLIIHLLNKKNTIVVDFSSIRFLKILEHESIKRLNLIQILLMIIRALIILFIILIITRPVVNGIYPIGSIDVSSSIAAIIVDDSFSINGVIDDNDRLTLTLSYLKSILNNLSQDQFIEIYLINKGVVFSGLVRDLANIENFIKTSNNNGNIRDYVKILNSRYKSEYINKELFLISDCQETVFDNVDASTLSSWNLFVFKIPDLVNNLAIYEVEILNNVILPNNSFEISAKIVNNGINDINNSLIQVLIDSTAIAQQSISLNSQDTISIDFILNLSDVDYTEIIFELSSDDNINDNKYFSLVKMIDKVEVGLICSNKEEFVFIDQAMTAINSINEFINFKSYQAPYISFSELSSNNIVFISGYNFVKNNYNDIEQFILSGGDVVIFPNQYDKDLSGISPFTESDLKNNFIETKSESFISTNVDDISYNHFMKIFNPSASSDMISNFKVKKYAQIPYAKETIVELGDNLSFMLSKRMQNGLVYVFAVAPMLSWSDLPLKGSFIPLILHLIKSSVHNDNDLNIKMSDQWILEPHNFIDITNIEIYNSAQLLTFPKVINDGYIKISKINNPGFYYTVGGDIDFGISLNIDSEELISKKLTKDNIESLINKDIAYCDDINNSAEVINQTRKGVELWRYFLYFLIILISIEMLISNANYNKKK